MLTYKGHDLKWVSFAEIEPLDPHWVGQTIEKGGFVLQIWEAEGNYYMTATVGASLLSKLL